VLCDKRYSQELAEAKKAKRRPVLVCPTTSLGAVAEGVFLFSVQTQQLRQVKVINTGAWQRVVSPAWLNLELGAALPDDGPRAHSVSSRAMRRSLSRCCSA
jgi:hypothetical protein